MYHVLYIVCGHQELSAYEVLQDFSYTADDEIRDFLQMVARFVTNYCLVSRPRLLR